MKAIRILPKRKPPIKIALLGESKKNIKRTALFKTSVSAIAKPTRKPGSITYADRSATKTNEYLILKNRKKSKHKVKKIKNMFVMDKKTIKSDEKAMNERIVDIRTTRPSRIRHTLKRLRAETKVVVQYVGSYQKHYILSRVNGSEVILLWNNKAFPMELMEKVIDDQDSDLSDDEPEVDKSLVPNPDDLPLSKISLKKAVSLINWVEQQEKKRLADMSDDDESDHDCAEEVLEMCCQMLDQAINDAKKRQKKRKTKVSKEQIAISLDHILFNLTKQRALMLGNTKKSTGGSTSQSIKLLDLKIAAGRRVIKDLKTNYTNKQIRIMEKIKDKQNKVLAKYLRKLTKSQFLKRIDLDLDEDDYYDPDVGEQLRHKAKRMYHTIKRGSDSGYKKCSKSKTTKFMMGIRPPKMSLIEHDQLVAKQDDYVDYATALLHDPNATGYRKYNPG